jgi:hypothetical protein
MKSLIPAVSLALFVSFAFSACETTGDNVLLGAAAGAAIGGAATGRGQGALAGAAIGAASGYVVGKAVQHERRRAYSEGYYEGREDRDGRYDDRDRDRYDDRDDRYDRDDRRYPYGRSLGNGYVTSPYHPYNRIDVRGIPRGAKVQDPSTGKIFINP